MAKANMKVQLSDKFGYKKIIKYTTPAICMMIFTSIYGVIDGLFVSNFAGKDAFSALNLIYPYLMILGSLGFMVGTGGNAIVSKSFGEKKNKEANNYFSLLIYTTFFFGIIIAIVGELSLPMVLNLLKADENLYPYALTYGRIMLIGSPFYMLQYAFQSFYNTAEKPNNGFIVTVISGVGNIIFDAIFIVAFKMGIRGAALGTIISQIIGAIIPLIYFLRKNNSLLKLGKTKWNIKILIRTYFNGLSEFVGNISISIAGIVFNLQLLKYIGDDGLAAYGTIMYINFIFISIFLGFNIGVSPIIGYKYGEGNKIELKKVVKKSMVLLSIFGILLTSLAIIFTYPISKLYVGYDESLFIMTKKAMYISAFTFLFNGISLFISALFTALGNGLVSTIVSFIRSFVFQVLCVIIFPLIFGVNGIWLSILFAEVFAMIFSLPILLYGKKKYGY